jgi:hypothetical protein
VWSADLRERTIPNTRHTVADGDGDKARAILERTIPNARHAVGDGDGGKARTLIERIITDARHLVCFSITIHFLWDDHNSAITTIISVLIRHNKFFTICGIVIVDSHFFVLYCDVVGRGSDGEQTQKSRESGDYKIMSHMIDV